MIGPGQTLIRKTREAVGEVRGETCTVLEFVGNSLGTQRFVKLSTGEVLEFVGWYFDPNNPSAWRVVELPKELRTLDGLFDAIFSLGAGIGHNEGGYSSHDPEVEALRAELKALVSCENCGEVRDCCRGCDPAHEPRSDR